MISDQDINDLFAITQSSTRAAAASFWAYSDKISAVLYELVAFRRKAAEEAARQAAPRGTPESLELTDAYLDGLIAVYSPRSSAEDHTICALALEVKRLREERPDISPEQAAVWQGCHGGPTEKYITEALLWHAQKYWAKRRAET